MNNNCLPKEQTLCSLPAIHYKTFTIFGFDLGKIHQLGSRNVFLISSGVQVSQGVAGRKSQWVLGDDSVCSVEEFSLRSFLATTSRSNYRGLHAENAIFNTLFSLLFYDIMFHPISRVFQTPFQSLIEAKIYPMTITASPLDLNTTSFYLNRAPLIESRLHDIENGCFKETIELVHSREFPDKTWCVGVDWSIPLDDLVEIAEVR